MLEANDCWNAEALSIGGVGFPRTQAFSPKTWMNPCAPVSDTRACFRDHTTEDEIVEEWVRRVFAPDSEDKRKSFRFHAVSVRATGSV